MREVPPNFVGLLEPPPSEDRNFLDYYCASTYSKLEADALLFNRELPHSGLFGSENEDLRAMNLETTFEASIFHQLDDKVAVIVVKKGD